MKTIQYNENDPRQVELIELLEATKSGNPTSIYLAPDPIERLKKANVRYIRARTIVEALEKLSSLKYIDAYILNVKTDLSPEEKVKVRTSSTRTNKRKIHVCIDNNLPYIEGLSILTKSEGLRQLL